MATQYSSWSTGTVTDGTSDGIDRDTVFGLPSSHRRRYATCYCKRQDGPVELGDLAEYVAARRVLDGVQDSRLRLGGTGGLP